MWNVNTTISSSLHNGKDLGTSASTSKTNIKNGGEWVRIVAFGCFNVVVLTIDLIGTLVQLVEIQLLQVTASQQKTGAVGSSVVRETNLHSIARQFMSIGRVDNDVSTDARVSDLK